MLPTAYESKLMFNSKTTITLINTKDEARLWLNTLLHELRTEKDKNIYIRTLHFQFYEMQIG